MDTVKIRELTEKSNVNLEDLVIVEDNDGTKVMQIRQFQSLVQKNTVFNTVDDMKNASLNEGDIIHTLGYHQLNDGGAALYKIVYAPTDVQDNQLIHYLYTSDTLRAHLIHNMNPNLMQCGARGDGLSDDRDEITKLLQLGWPIHFPERTYRVSGSLKIPNNRVIDFNNATIYCADAACITIGHNEEAKNITIKNAIFKGQYGVDIWSGADGITIENCQFMCLNSNSTMSRAIRIQGAKNVTISNCVIGSNSDPVSVGIEISSGSFGGKNQGCSNIKVMDVDMTVTNNGIYCTSTFVDRSIAFLGTRIKTYGTNIDNTSAIKLSNLSDGMSFSNTIISNFNKGVEVTNGDTSVSFTDMTVVDSRIMYNVSSDRVNIYLSGLQKFIAGSGGSYYIFEKMTGNLYLSTTIDTEVNGSGKIVQGKDTGSLNGKVTDTIPYTSYDKIAFSDVAIANNNTPIDNKIPGFHNVCLDINSSSATITNFTHPSLSGQILAVYGNGVTVKNNTHISMESDWQLNKYIPLILRNENSVWKRIG